MCRPWVVMGHRWIIALMDGGALTSAPAELVLVVCKEEKGLQQLCGEG